MTASVSFDVQNVSYFKPIILCNGSEGSENAEPSSSDYVSSPENNHSLEVKQKETKTSEVKDDNFSKFADIFQIFCHYCKSCFADKETFEQHCKQHAHLKPYYSCTICNKKTLWYDLFKKHCLQHIYEKEHGYCTCPHCQRLFTSERTLMIHIGRTHSKGDLKPRKWGNPVTTAQKPNSSQPSTKKKYSCAECGRVFQMKYYLKRHIRNHAEFQCKYCPNTYIDKSRFIQHVNTHSSHRPYKCSVCSKSFKSTKQLSDHSETHRAWRPFTCNKCGKGFLTQLKLQQHVNIHTGEKPYTCDICRRNFTNLPNLLKHKRRRHPIDPETGKPASTPQPATNVTAFICDICDTKFVKNKYLLHHKRTVNCRKDTHDKPFICQTCKKGFNRRCNLRMHMKRHPQCDVPPKSADLFNYFTVLKYPDGKVFYLCNICLKQYLNKSTVKMHLKKHVERAEDLNCDLSNLLPETCSVPDDLLEILQNDINEDLDNSITNAPPDSGIADISSSFLTDLELYELNLLKDVTDVNPQLAHVTDGALDDCVLSVPLSTVLPDAMDEAEDPILADEPLSDMIDSVTDLLENDPYLTSVAEFFNNYDGTI